MPKGDYQRLKADIEDGIVPIAHLLIEALSMAKLNGVAKGIVLFIWRRTYGWSEGGAKKHKDDRITLAEFAQAVNSERTYVSTQLKALVRAKVVYEFQDPENGRYKRYGMNTDVAAWSTNVIDVEALAAAVQERLYVHSSRTVQQTQNGFVNTQPFANTQPLSESTTKPLCKSTTLTLEIPSDGAGNGASKNSIEKYIAEDDKSPPKPPDKMSAAEFEDEVEYRMRVHMNKHSYRLVKDDYKALHDLLDQGVDRQFILDGITEIFQYYKTVSKGPLDTINTFLYCAKRIAGQWESQQAAQQIAVGGEPGGNTVRSRSSRRKNAAAAKSITGGKVGRV